MNKFIFIFLLNNLIALGANADVFHDKYVTKTLELESMVNKTRNISKQIFDQMNEMFLITDNDCKVFPDLVPSCINPQMRWVSKVTVVAVKDITKDITEAFRNEALNINTTYGLSASDKRLTSMELEKSRAIQKVAQKFNLAPVTDATLKLVNAMTSAPTVLVNLDEVGQQEIIFIDASLAQKVLQEMNKLISFRNEMWSAIHSILGADLGNNNDFDSNEKFIDPTFTSIVFLGTRDEIGYETALLASGLLSRVEVYNITNLEKIKKLTLEQAPLDGNNQQIKMILYSWGGKKPMYLTKLQAEDLKTVLELSAAKNRE